MSWDDIASTPPAYVETIAAPLPEPSNNVITHGPFFLTETGVVESRPSTFDEWEACFDWAQKAEKCVQFWLGDLLELGERRHGEKYTQALNANVYAEQTLRNLTYVARAVPQERRREDLPFSVHAEVAALSPEKQVEFLQKAADEQLTRDQVRAHVRQERAEHGIISEFWLVVRCACAEDQLELAARMRQEGRSVKLR